MVRHEDWPKRLSQYLADKMKAPFEWGVNDCIMFGAKGIEALTGVNHYQEYVGYTDEQGAKELLKQNGGIEGIVSKHLGPGHRNILKAKRGDMVLLKIDGFTCGLIDDSGQFIAAVTEEGLTRIPLKRAWRIWSY